MDELNLPGCMVCHGPIRISLTRKGNGLCLQCQKDARHYRAFVMDKEFVQGVLRRAEHLDNQDHECS